MVAAGAAVILTTLLLAAPTHPVTVVSAVALLTFAVAHYFRQETWLRRKANHCLTVAFGTALIPGLSARVGVESASAEILIDGGAYASIAFLLVGAFFAWLDATKVGKATRTSSTKNSLPTGDESEHVHDRAMADTYFESLPMKAVERVFDCLARGFISAVDLGTLDGGLLDLRSPRYRFVNQTLDSAAEEFTVALDNLLAVASRFFEADPRNSQFYRHTKTSYVNYNREQEELDAVRIVAVIRYEALVEAIRRSYPDLLVRSFAPVPLRPAEVTSERDTDLGGVVRVRRVDDA